MSTVSLSKTAFLIAWGRSQFPEISHDPYAYFWLTPEGIAFAEKFAKEITPLAPYFHSLRSRYLIEQLKNFEKDHHSFTLINIGSGITSYPFILSEKVTVYELDQEQVLSFRKKQVEAGIKKGVLPKRSIHYVAVDLNDKSSFDLLRTILSQQMSPSFVLFEGILPYLKKSQATQLIDVCAKHLISTSKIMIHIFLEEYKTSPIRKKVIQFFDKELGLANHNFTYFTKSKLENIAGLQLIEHVGFFELQGRYSPDRTFSEDELIDERFFLFEKI